MAYEDTDAKISTSIENLLKDFFALEFSKEAVDCGSLVADDILKDIYNLKLNSLVDFNVKNEVADSSIKVNILKINQINSNTFDINFTLDKAFIIYGEESSESGTEYMATVVEDNGKFLIKKLVDNIIFQEFLNNDEEDSVIKNKSLNDDIQYNKFIERELILRKEFEENKSQLIEKLYTQKEELKDSKSYNGYNGQAAVNYAHQWCGASHSKGTRNPQYFNYGDNDCQNFVSQCVYNGGIPRTDGWHHYVNSDYSIDATKSWRLVESFYPYMKNGYTWGDDYYNSWKVGDVVQFQRGSTYTHSVILTDVMPNGTPKYSGHSNNRCNYPLERAISEQGYSNWRYIKFWR